MLDLRKYVPSGRVSSGLLAWWQDRIVFAVAQERYWVKQTDQTRISLIGIGGGQEAGETLIDTIRREAREEANAEINIKGAQATLWIDAEGNVTRPNLQAELSGEPAPLLIWQLQVTLRRDDGTPYTKDYISPVYEAEFITEPTPGMETPGLLFLPADSWLSLLDQPRPLSALLQSGCEYIGAALPEDTVLELQGSAQFLARYWADLPRLT